MNKAVLIKDYALDLQQIMNCISPLYLFIYTVCTAIVNNLSSEGTISALLYCTGI